MSNVRLGVLACAKSMFYTSIGVGFAGSIRGAVRVHVHRCPFGEPSRGIQMITTVFQCFSSNQVIAASHECLLPLSVTSGNSLVADDAQHIEASTEP